MPNTQDPPNVTTTEAQIHRVALKIPPFWSDEPELWFAQLESQFTLGEIVQDGTKYAYVLSHVETRHAKEIKDLITNPPVRDKYESIKKALIQRLSVSQEQQIRQLLETEEMGDRRPSQFLRHLQALASSAIPEQLLRTLWMGRLPAQLQAILATRNGDNLDEVAEQADRIHEVTCRAVAVASIQPATAKPAATKTTLEQQIELLTKQVENLHKRMSRSKNKEDSRGRSRSRSRQDQPEGGVCFYHRRFKEKALKCTPPCNFKKQVEN
ncbi:PREDICTED: uncharacterized protein LOC105570774 [Vollenhovia emeryi]|uniref:uncharacterized protein LOC105570774 n=1 Tax=Vollenhovia emeryi TaxID=411798 RepID=UPI0005F429D2|nr:PREDICTED: uncharacterized protein LOC105570774 [Vollenhovia emeryi]